MGRTYEVVIILLFFIVTTLSLFWGDGLQAPVETIWAGVVLLLYGLLIIEKRNTSVPHYKEWTLLFAYFILRSVFSDSLGYSTTSFMRLVEACFTYIIFYSLSSPKTLRVFSRGVIVVTLVGVGLAILVAIIPNLTFHLPTMNLVYATFGHNHLADILLFAIPIAASMSTPLFTLLLVAMVLTFARGAWFICGLYFTGLLVFRKDIPQKMKATIVVAGAMFILLFVGATIFAQLPHHTPPPLSDGLLFRQLLKPPIYTQRIQYWLQAVHTIMEHPLFGSGPGTFFLDSIRQQSAPASYSWFAHSLPLQLFAELGLLGVFCVAFLFLAIGKELKRYARAPVVHGVVLTFLYSCIEYNLDFLVVWLLFC